MNTNFFYQVSWALSASGYFVTKYHIDDHKYVTISTENGKRCSVGLWVKTPDGDTSITFRDHISLDEAATFIQDCTDETL